MSWYAMLGWVAGLWVAVGLDAAIGGSLPGVALVLVIAAGLWSGPAAGAVLGVLAGLCDAALSGRDLLALLLVGSLTGVGAGLVSRRLSRRHLLVGMASAAVFSVLASLLLSAGHGVLSPALALPLARLGGENALWMIPIYGIVFMVSARRVSPRISGQ